MFRLTYKQVRIPLKRTFTISRGSRDAIDVVYVALESEGITGYGEAAPNHRYNETAESVTGVFKSFESGGIKNPFDSLHVNEYIGSLHKSEFSAKAALEMAVLDWVGKKLKTPVHRLWNAPSITGPKTSFTIGIDEPSLIAGKVKEAEGYPILKVKLGSPYDREIIEEIRKATDKPVLVDANEGWKTVDEAMDNIRFLAGMNIELIEQPMPSSMHAEMTILKQQSEIPLIADESFTGREDLGTLSDAFHGINIKLMKTGSMRVAMQKIAEARIHGLKVMIGCMVETSLADTASAILSLWADYADIDGHLLVSRNPFTGVVVNKDGYVTLNDLDGLGVELKEDIFD
jgi:L-alanine-DL-glutamate epimerase-like enolase superfamily enzyme